MPPKLQPSVLQHMLTWRNSITQILAYKNVPWQLMNNAIKTTEVGSNLLSRTIRKKEGRTQHTGSYAQTLHGLTAFFLITESTSAMLKYFKNILQEVSATSHCYVLLTIHTPGQGRRRSDYRKMLNKKLSKPSFGPADVTNHIYLQKCGRSFGCFSELWIWNHHKLYFRSLMHKVYARRVNKPLTVPTLTAVLELTHGSYMVSTGLLIGLWFEFHFPKFATRNWRHIILFI